MTIDQVRKRVKELRSAHGLMSHVQAIKSDTLTLADAEEEWNGFEDDEGPIAVDIEDQLGLEVSHYTRRRIQQSY